MGCSVRVWWGLGGWLCQWQGSILHEDSLVVAGGPSLHLPDVCEKMPKEQGLGFPVGHQLGSK